MHHNIFAPPSPDPQAQGALSKRDVLSHNAYNQNQRVCVSINLLDIPCIQIAHIKKQQRYLSSMGSGPFYVVLISRMFHIHKDWNSSAFLEFGELIENTECQRSCEKQKSMKEKPIIPSRLDEALSSLDEPCSPCCPHPPTSPPPCTTK